MPKKDSKSSTAAVAQKKKTTTENPLFERRPKNFSIGNLQPKRDLSRFVRWPRYVKVQRQKRILLQRLRVPPTINQFSRTADKGTATQVFKLLHKYRPETKVEKKERLVKKASEVKEKGAQKETGKKPNFVKHGLNHVTNLIEQKEAKLVVIAHDVEPIELVVWLPTLCRKMGVPYMIVKGKSRLGAVVHRKTATVLALTSVDPADKGELEALVNQANESFNKNADLRKTWGGGKLGVKSLAALRKREKAIAKERITA